VIGGSVSATLVRFTFPQVRRALNDFVYYLNPVMPDTAGTVQQLIELAKLARRQGLVAIDRELEKIPDPFMKTAMRLAADGVDAKAIESALSVKIKREKDEIATSAAFYEQAGGFAPTIGVLGAVLGLIHVMGNITNPDALGAGIAVAFVATLYGVGVANLFFLPMGGKIKMRAIEHAHHLELIMEGAVSIAAGENPLVTEQKLMAWVHDDHGAPAKGGEKKPGEAAA
jgi:chemotaxis protein MotA